MAQQAPAGGDTVTRSYRTGITAPWWGALVLVSLVLGFVGRGDGGFWSAFLWSIVGFVVGSLIALAVAGQLVKARSEDEAFADVATGAAR